MRALRKALRAALAMVFAALLWLTPGFASCDDSHLTIRGDFGQARFAVEIADDPAARARGLMFVERMPLMTGMLFIYERPQPVSFWMKNTLIPLDMLFVSPRGEVLHIHENAIPGDLTPIPGGPGVQMVLEINGGMAARLGLAVGDVMQHPSFGPGAILPCAENHDS